MPAVASQSSIRPEELHRLLAAGTPCELLDVRTPPEHAAAHVSGVQLVPLDDLDPKAFLAQRKDAGQPLYVLCQSGGRAQRAIEKFERAGFQNCVLVEGGTEAWMDAGLPVNRGQSRVLPLIRQVQIIVGLLSATGAVLALTVNPWWAVVPLVMGCGLLCAGVTGFCGLALVLTRMPWNRCAQGKSCCST